MALGMDPMVARVGMKLPVQGWLFTCYISLARGMRMSLWTFDLIRYNLG